MRDFCEVEFWEVLHFEKGARLFITVVSLISPPADCQIATLDVSYLSVYFRTLIVKVRFFSSTSCPLGRHQPPVTAGPHGLDLPADAGEIKQVLLERDPALLGVDLAFDLAHPELDV